MRKFIISLVLVLCFCSSVFAWGGWDSGRISTNLFATGSPGGVSEDCETGTTSLPSASYAYVEAYVTTRTLTMDNGTRGQILTIIGKEQTDTGTLTLDATTQSGWDTITLDSSNDWVTFLYLNDTQGWIVTGYNSITINN